MAVKSLSQPYKELLYLIRCAVRQEKPSASWDLTSPLSSLLRLAQFHSIEALLFDTVKHLSLSDADKETLKDWQLEHDKAFRRHLLFTAERKAIISQMEQAQIWSMPLKGVVLQEDYPHPHYRQMSDNDILFDADKREVIRDIMVAREYSVIHFNYGVDDAYHKPPFYNFEMHVGAGVAPEFKTYFADLTERLLSPTPYSRQMTAKDFYLYLLSHELKHYQLGGTGLRSLIDLQFYLAKHQADLDWDEIDSIISLIDGALDFEKRRRHLVDCLFSDTFEDFEAVFDDANLAYYCTSGTYGILENSVENSLSIYNHTFEKFYQFYFRKFLRVYDVGKNRESLKNYQFLLPFFMVYRTIRGFFNPRNWQELALILKKVIKK